MNKRVSGLLFHISSIPTPFGIGDFGPEAYRFADFLAQSRQHFWQILPLNPTDPGTDNSPYLSQSAYALNPLLISPEYLIEEKLLDKKDLKQIPCDPKNRIPYAQVIPEKNRLLQIAYANFRKRSDHSDCLDFCHEQAWWLDDYALFVALKKHFGGVQWTTWEKPLRDRDPESLAAYRDQLADLIEERKFYQWIAFKQWMRLKNYCNERQIRIIGDIPIYVAHESVDVWANPQFFKLDDSKMPTHVAGVPPDYFSETGQLWGNPVYNWKALKDQRFRWWNDRVARNLSLFNVVRIDHFRGLVAYWEVAADQTTAIHGQWAPVPVYEFLDQLQQKFPNLPIIAEDLGTITQDVKDVIAHYQVPGMKVLMFAFGEDIRENPYIPHNLPESCVLYTGTHDNNTLVGWFESETDEAMRKRIAEYLGHMPTDASLAEDFLKLSMESVANWVIFPVQDILGMGPKDRMNNPATSSGNWQWRLPPGKLTPDVANWLADWTIQTKRS